jgi:hypothetical protein
MTNVRRLMGLVATGVALSACTERLQVTNPNSGDRTRALGRPADVENLLSGGFNSVHQTVLGGTENVNSSMQVMSLENFSALANFNMGPRGAIPRAPILNFRNNPGSASVVTDWNGLHRASRTMAIGISQLDGGLSLGTAAATARGRSFGYFASGLAAGYLGMVYDSVALVLPFPNQPAVPPLVGADSAGRSALRLLDSAIVYARAGAGAFPLPAAWINAGTMDTTRFIQVIRSYKAKIRASMARTATENSAVTWSEVLADAQAGIATDLNVAMNPASGWSQGWIIQHFAGTNWHQAAPMIIGMADTSGDYGAWLNQPLGSRGAIRPLIRTPDRRFPAGATRAAQNTASNCAAATCVSAVPSPGVYFRNRLGADDGNNDGTWGMSLYDHARFMAFQLAGRIGSFPVLTAAEVRLLAAEAAVRTGAFATALPLVNVSRTANGLPAITATDNTTPVPGGTACVPRIPVPGANNTYTTTCGNLLEAIKWEKRMETSYTSYGAWFFDSRRWNDLPVGTPLSFPVPWQEMDTRVKNFYNLGGVGNPGGAVGPSTYGF